jgi:serine protease AprX
LFSKRRIHNRWLPAAFICAVAFSTGGSAAWCGEIAPELLSKLHGGGSAQEHAVIIRLKEAIDYRNLRTLVESKTQGERVQTVVQELKTRTGRSQQALRMYLGEQEKLGRVRKMKPFWIFNGIAVTAAEDAIRELAAGVEVAEVVSDEVFTLGAPAAAAGAAPAGWNLERIGVRPLWSAGYTGAGVVVANLDTGVDINHPDLGPKWRGGTNSWFDPAGEHPTPADVNGHGTQTMGIMTAGNTTDHLFGVAPGAQWIAAKIFDDAGASSFSITHQAFQWVLDPDADPNTNDAPAVVNCSWDLGNAGGVDQEFQTDVQALKTAGIVVVFSAGNDGPAANSSVSPANYPESFSVGMTDSEDVIDPRSSRGPSAFGGTSVYPTVVAPGAGIRTTDLWFGSMDLSTITVNGTSFSAPHAAGAMALLLSSNPTLTVGQMESAITQAAWDLGTTGSDNDYGYGFVDVERAARLLNILPPAAKGDVNGNGMLDLDDVLTLLRTAVGFTTSTVDMKRAEAGGDVFPSGAGDGAITVSDVLTLLGTYAEAQ